MAKQDMVNNRDNNKMIQLLRLVADHLKCAKLSMRRVNRILDEFRNYALQNIRSIPKLKFHTVTVTIRFTGADTLRYIECILKKLDQIV